jgi:dipeptidase E
LTSPTWRPTKDFSAYDVIYVEGGNTFKLLRFAKDANFKQTIEKLLARGGVYIGVSAGSAIMCPNIKLTEWKVKAGLRPDKNRFDLTDLTAFDFAPFLLVVHFAPEQIEIVKKFIQEEAVYPVRVLTDEQAFVIKNGQTILIGHGQEIIF